MISGHTDGPPLLTNKEAFRLGQLRRHDDDSERR